MYVYVVKLNSVEYLEFRGGYDWGRTTDRSSAGEFDTKEEAIAWAKMSGGKVLRRQRY